MDEYENRKKAALKSIRDTMIREHFYSSETVKQSSSRPWLSHAAAIDKRLLIRCAILGTEPHYEDMEELRLLGAGHFAGGFRDKWDWTPMTLEQLSTEELEHLFCWLHRKKGEKACSS